MSDKPHLKWVACHHNGSGVASWVRRTGTRITKGQLCGCWRAQAFAPTGDKITIFKLGRGYVLEFRLSIRVRA